METAQPFATAPPRPKRGYRMLALDIDGTLLDRQGLLRPSTAEAVARAARAGIQPVLCTGRRYRRALPVAQQLGLDAPLVCNSGAIVKNPSDHGTLWRADLEPQVLVEALRLFREHNEPVVSFTDRPSHEPDFLVERAPSGREHFDNYLDRNAGHVGLEPGWTTRAEFLNRHHFHLCAIGTLPAMLAFETAIVEALDDRVRTFVQKSPKYTGTMCELIRKDAGKWAAIVHLAELWGIGPDEIVAIGDDMNDLPMIAGAGLGVAMGHAPSAVRDVADLITGDHDNDGVSMLVERLLLAG